MIFENYSFINVALGGVEKRKTLIKTSELTDYARDWRNKNKKDFIDCYRTYFRYPSEMLEHFKAKQSVSGYIGPCYADFLPIDIDSPILDRSLELTKELLIHLERAHGIDLKTVGI